MHKIPYIMAKQYRISLSKKEGLTIDNIIRVHRPELTEDERARRMEQIKEAAARLIIAADAQKSTIRR